MIPDRVTAMLFVDGYFLEFWRVIQERGCSHREAWSSCEATLERYNFPHRYDSYESFKVGKHRTAVGGAEESTGQIYVW